MKKLFSLIALLGLLAISAKADGIVVFPLAANTASNVLSGNFIVQAITILNSSTNTATVKLFDSATAATNVYKYAYTSYASYATNFSTVFTNEANVLVTNTFVGVYTGPTSHATNTAVLPTLYTLMVPASATLSKDITIMTSKGLTAVPDQSCSIAVTYKGNP
jgi:hypothetical protein